MLTSETSTTLPGYDMIRCIDIGYYSSLRSHLQMQPARGLKSGSGTHSLAKKIKSSHKLPKTEEIQ